MREVSAEELNRRQKAADVAFLNQGITFTVYGREEGTEKIMPYDLVPRIIPGDQWKVLEEGLTQRITAILQGWLLVSRTASISPACIFPGTDSCHSKQ